MGYLMLSRKENEKIMITCPDGTVLEMVIAEISGKQERREPKVRLGFNGPREYIFDREEVFHQKREQHASNKSTASKVSSQAKATRG